MTGSAGTVGIAANALFLAKIAASISNLPEVLAAFLSFAFAAAATAAAVRALIASASLLNLSAITLRA